MKQLTRRSIYLVLGLTPALITLWESPHSVVILVGTMGLLLATISSFPVRRTMYFTITAMLVVGLLFAVPFAAIFLYTALEAGLTQIDLLSALLIWVLFGCPSVAIHFILRARAPNNSFKPTPLRGAA